jgi:hypothetical protein
VKRALLCLLAALAFAACFEFVLALVTWFIPADAEGGPLTLPSSNSWLWGGTSADPDTGRELINILLTGGLLWLCTVCWRCAGLAIGALGLAIGLSVQIIWYSLTRPVAPHGGRVDHIVLWLNRFLIGALVIAFWRIAIRMTAPQRPQATRRPPPGIRPGSRYGY